MTLQQIRDILDANVISGEENLDDEVFSGCGCDLISDVLTYAREKVLLLTGLINMQIIRAADTMGIKAVMFVRGKSPTPDMISLAKSKGVVLMNTGYPLYVASGLLYANGLGGLKL